MTKDNILIQPIIDTELSGLITDSQFINDPAAMYIYEIQACSDCSFSFHFIPSAFCEWIIGYNRQGEDAAIYCVGPSIKSITILPGQCSYSNYFCVRFDDDVFYLNNTTSRVTFPADMRDQVVEYNPANDFYEHELIHRFQKSTSFTERIHLFIHFLSKCRTRYSFPVSAISVHDMIKNSHGCISISECSQLSGYSERHINRVHTAEFGYGPKFYCKCVRFQKVLLEIISDPQRHNSEFIQNIGYCDQAHFQREFKMFMGKTPKQFIHNLMTVETPT
jgi:AraC-like DNA-binding protein